MSWVESTKWVHARKDKADMSSRKGEGWCQEYMNKKLPVR